MLGYHFIWAQTRCTVGQQFNENQLRIIIQIPTFMDKVSTLILRKYFPLLVRQIWHVVWKYTLLEFHTLCFQPSIFCGDTTRQPSCMYPAMGHMAHSTSYCHPQLWWQWMDILSNTAFLSPHASTIIIMSKGQPNHRKTTGSGKWPGPKLANYYVQ